MGIRNLFKGEDIRTGPPQQWLGRSWELRLGAVRGTIYKVAVETVARDRDDAVSFSTDLVSMLMKVLGEAQKVSEAIFVWDAEDGNAVLQLASSGGERRLMLFLTSRLVRTFERI